MIKNFILSAPLILIFVAIFSSCSQEEPILEKKPNNNIAESYYSELSSLPTISIPSISDTQISRSENDGGIPGLTSEDLKYLSSLSQKEIQALIEKLESRIDTYGREKVEEIEVNNYNRILDLIGGYENMNQYTEFSMSYLETEGGINSLQMLMPQNLNENQVKLYVAMAVYIDRTTRPFMKYIVQLDNNASRSHEEGCRAMAAFKLSLLGLSIGVDAFLDITTAGAAVEFTDIELLANYAELCSIRSEYDLCMNRVY